MTRPDWLLRPATGSDVKELVELENESFDTDKLSRRSFQRFLKPGPHDLVVAERDARVVAYALALYRTGTGLARLYSIAVQPALRGKGLAKALIEALEIVARQRRCAFMRLEVEVDNERAIGLYRRIGYRVLDRIPGYYDDGGDALRLEKRIYPGRLRSTTTTPYYQQTTDFTCGPAALMMAMKSRDPAFEMSRQEELRIWREATTIFMTSGLGGCSPHGLALSAWKRGFKVALHINSPDPPFVDSVRDADKKAVIELVHEDFQKRLRDTDVEIHAHDPAPGDVADMLNSGQALVALISTWRLNRNKAPHWVFVADADEDFVYISDPDQREETWQSETDYIQVPVSVDEFVSMACFGRRRLRCLIALEK